MDGNSVMNSQFENMSEQDMEQQERTVWVDQGWPKAWSIREFEVSPKTGHDCAVYQLIVDYNGVAFLFSDEYSNIESSGVLILKERINKMVEKLNE